MSRTMVDEFPLQKVIRQHTSDSFTEAFEQPFGQQMDKTNNLRTRLTEVYGDDTVIDLPKDFEETVQKDVKKSIGSGIKTNNESSTNPFTNEEETLERSELTRKMQDFYSKYNKEKLRNGVGHYVIFTEKFGLNALNRRLMKLYGADLETSIENLKQKEVEKKRAKKKREEERKQHVKLRQALSKYLKRHDKKNVVVTLPVLYTYGKERGGNELSRFLQERYGEPLPGYTPSEKVDIVRHDIDVDMLVRYYKKHNPKFLEEENNGAENVAGILQWTRVNGVRRLDEELVSKYSESFSEFSEKTLRLRDDIARFHQELTDEELPIEDIEGVVDWAVVHGRQAVNYELYKRYGRHLDTEDAKEYEADRRRSQNLDSPNRVSF